MYKNLYSYNEEINGKSVWMICKPNFREAITLFDGENKILSDGKVIMVGDLVLKGTRSQYSDVFISEDAQWGLEVDGHTYKVFVTERTDEIKTPLGSEWNKQFNRILKKCKNDYYKKKKKEIRLYFYEASKDKLRLCYLGNPHRVLDYYNYSLDRYFGPYCAIDKRYTKPDKDCFILGRVRKTIGLKNSKLLDFIEPVHEMTLDFEKEEYDFGDYERNIANLEKNIYELLEFSIAKKHSTLQEMRIRAFLQNSSGTQESVIHKFNKEIWNAFEKGDVPKVRQLDDVLNTPQDCTHVKFELRLKEEVTCSPDKKFDIFFENREFKYLPAKWIYANIHNCTDASGIYLGEVTNRYNFY